MRSKRLGSDYLPYIEMDKASQTRDNVKEVTADRPLGPTTANSALTRVRASLAHQVACYGLPRPSSSSSGGQFGRSVMLLD